jgi:putative transposase
LDKNLIEPILNFQQNQREESLKMNVTRSYGYRLYPTNNQQTTLAQWAGCRRVVWNWALRCKQAHFQATGRSLSYAALCSALTELKRLPDTQWLKDCHSQVLQQVLVDLETAFANFFEKRANYPRWKTRKHTLHSLRFPQNVTVVDNQTISVPKIGLVNALIHRPLQGVAKSATIKQDATGKWWVIFVCQIDRPDVQLTADHPVGVDVGLESFLTLHTGQKVAPPKFYRHGEKKLKRLARKLARAKRGSANRKKAKQRLARAHQRIRNRRSDWLHKQAMGILRQFDTVCIETLNIRGLARTKLAKSFSDAALGTFLRMLAHKAEWHGRQIVAVGRFFPSSKLCHRCREKTVLTLSHRIWTCSNPHCGVTHDRDVNAAINIMQEGLRLLAAGQSRG